MAEDVGENPFASAALELGKEDSGSDDSFSRYLDQAHAARPVEVVWGAGQASEHI